MLQIYPRELVLFYGRMFYVVKVNMGRDFVTNPVINHKML
jgi:hypothetical protein